jgi:anti-anti-sigma factor
VAQSFPGPRCLEDDLVSFKSQTAMPMSQEHLQIEEVSGSRDGIRIFRLAGPLVLASLSSFQSKVRADISKALILDFTGVPYLDSAAIGALVGAHMNRQKEGRSMALVGVNQRIRQAFEVTRIESLLHFYDSVVEAENAVA